MIIETLKFIHAAVCLKLGQLISAFVLFSIKEMLSGFTERKSLRSFIMALGYFK